MKIWKVLQRKLDCAYRVMYETLVEEVAESEVTQQSRMSWQKLRVRLHGAV